MEEKQFIQRNFNTIWPVHLAAFTRLLTQLRARFDGDLDLVLVLAVIGGRIRSDHWSSALVSARELTTNKDHEDRQYPINIQSVAEYSGIPRETVRRKVAVLQRKGWVTRDAKGRLSASGKAAEDLEAETQNSIAYLAALLAAFDAARDAE
jgi:hypothetical protein